MLAVEVYRWSDGSYLETGYGYGFGLLLALQGIALIWYVIAQRQNSEKGPLTT